MKKATIAVVAEKVNLCGSSVLWVGGFAVIAGAGLRFPCIISESSNDHCSLSLGPVLHRLHATNMSLILRKVRR